MRIPTEWSEVSLSQYIKIVEISAIDMDSLDRNVKYLSILTGEEESVFLNMSLPQVKEVVRHIKFIYTKPGGNKLRKSYKIKGTKYLVNYEINTLTGGEYIDLTEFTKDKLKITSNLPNIIAIFFKPTNIFGYKKGKRYSKGVQTAESRISTAEDLMEGLTVEDMAGLSGFFLNCYVGLTKATADFIIKNTEKTVKKMKKEMKKRAFLNFGGGN